MVHNGYNHHDEKANYILTGYMYNDYSKSFGKNLKANICKPPDGLQDWRRLGKVE